MFKCVKIDHLLLGYITYYINIEVYKQSKKEEILDNKCFGTLLTKSTDESIVYFFFINTV